ILNTAMEPRVFNFYTYAFSAILLSVMLIFGLKGNKRESASIVSFANIAGCAAIAVCLYINSFSKTLAAGYLTSAQIYPVLQGSNLICSALLARILFNEKITAKSVAGMVCAFAGLMIMNIK
ncbi:MAG: EamA family transporter, partial [Clostridia bacterium]|nr:EamA family transporter [Clostridia bacterium]